jgi:hypothetical protein
MSENYAYGPYVPVTITAEKPEHGRTGFATTSMVLGIVAGVMAFVPIIGLIAFVLAPLAIIFGALGRKSSKSGQATAGLVLGVIALAISVAWAVMFGAFVGAVDSSATCINAAQTIAEINACN